MKPILNVIHKGDNHCLSSETGTLLPTNKGKKQWKMVVTEYDYNLFYTNNNNHICKGDQGTLSYSIFSSNSINSYKVVIDSVFDDKKKKEFQIYIREI